ncbi:MAG: exopolyphosphatase [Gammaproteobacteria bacterium]|jgi:exopolyphosphatase/guanosine-5'-triphosphate,3'-diphosphate pyrophosphatase|nr:exopolyphosphatase [Gammaproteobacteria bacterium]MBU1406725.1 exopolyphosphatase [Gammaproteobacteria bacterium]MBU1533357.1 exopolyphosphatase [Gammaproteobacteria bacterium]
MKTYDALAAVDLGSNSFRLEVARVAGDQLYPLDSLKETVRLAGGLGDDKILDEATQECALACLQRFGERLRGLSPEAIRCVGTSALRVARNADVFIPQAEIALGHPIEIVAGREEARLIYLGVAHSLPASPDRRLVVDIGGGSTEFIIGHGLKPHERESLHMGCVNFSKRFFAGGVIDKAALKTAEMAARVEVERIAREFSKDNWQQAVGSSGTARALREILEQCGWSARGITADGLAQLRSQLIKAGHVDALDLPGLARDRRPVIAGGFAIMAGLFAELGIEQMDVAETAMREGILYDLLGRFHQQDMREATVDEFARRYHIDAQQAARVKRVALNLLASCGGGSEADERFLDWAARLHEIGLSVSHGGYHRHSGYILENADMPGFSRTEQARLALLARAQRGALIKLPAFAAGAVPDNDRLLVWLLRQAVILCRSRAEPHLPNVKAEAGNKRFRLTLPDGWLESRPLTQRALEEEAAHWHAVGMKYAFD